MGIERAPVGVLSLGGRPPCGGAKGPGVRTVAEKQAIVNHIASIKAKSIESHNVEPSFVLGGFSVPQMWDRLAENALRSNAVNSSVTNRRASEGASNQTTRLPCRIVGQAAAAQVATVAVAMAEARRRLRAHGVPVVNAVATNSANACMLATVDTSAFGDTDYFCVTSTKLLLYNASPAKLTTASIIAAASEIAALELQHFQVSSAMGQRSEILLRVCRSVVGDDCFDAVWSSIILLVYLSSHPRGRALLRTATRVTVRTVLATATNLRKTARVRLSEMHTF